MNMELRLIPLTTGDQVLILIGAENHEKELTETFTSLGFSNKIKEGLWILPMASGAKLNIQPIIDRIPGARKRYVDEIEISRGRTYAEKLRAEQELSKNPDSQGTIADNTEQERKEEPQQRGRVEDQQVEEPTVTKESLKETKAKRSKQDQEASAGIRSLTRTVRLGVNHNREPVYKGASGRFVKLENRIIKETDAEGQSLRFLRAKTEEDRIKLAEAIIENMEGKSLKKNMLRKWADAIMEDTHHSDHIKFQLAQRAIEIAMVRYLASPQKSDDLFAASLDLYESHRSTKRKEGSRQDPREFLTPAPLGLITANILQDTSNFTAFIPSAGNGALINGLSMGTKVYLWDIDPALSNALAETATIAGVRASTYHRDATKGEMPPHRVTVAHPPFAERQAEMYQDMELTRIDLQIMMRSLEAREDGGVSIYYLGGENAPAPEQLDMVLAYLNDNFYILAQSELQAGHIGSSVSDANLRTIIVGNRLGPNETPTMMPILTPLDSFESMYSWGKRLGPIVNNHTAHFDRELEERKEIEEQREKEVQVEQELELKNIDRSRETRYQTPYVSASRAGEPTSMVPKNLEAATRRALARLVNRVGNIDEYVMDAAQWRYEELKAYLSPEQIDAVAMWKYNKDHRDSGFALGDMTGRGKGRALAAMARINLLNGERVIFGTSKPNLCSDWFRDWRDIGSEELFRESGLVLMNGYNPIIDLESKEELIQPTDSDDLKEMVMAGRLPDECRLMLFTYSQINHAADAPLEERRRYMSYETWAEIFLQRDLDPSTAPTFQEARSRAFIRMVTGANLLLDEAHNIAGRSNTGHNILAATERARNITYSTATNGNTPLQISMFKAILPKNLSQYRVQKILTQGGELLMETITQSLVEDGRMLRREGTYDDIDYEIVHPTEDQLAHNKNLVDIMSPPLQALALLSRELTDYVNTTSQEANDSLQRRMLAAGENGRPFSAPKPSGFGSRLHIISKIQSVILNVPMAIEQAVKKLEEGHRVVFFVQSTVESLMKEIQSDLAENGWNLAETAAAPDMKDMMRIYLDRIMEIRILDGETGRYDKRPLDSLPEDIQTLYHEVLGLIEELPALPISPFDMIRDGILDAGYRFEEISGRTTTWRAGKYYKREKPPVASIVSDFKNDEIDVIAMSQAGCEGISLHTEEGERPTVAIELQIAESPKARLQYYGRLSRLGQVANPTIISLRTGIPSHDRQTQMSNKSLERLQANATADRKNSIALNHETDYLNPIGDMAASRLLVENPDLAETLSMRHEREQVSKHELIYGETPKGTTQYMVSKLLLNMCVLPTDDQEIWMQALSDAYQDILLDIENRGLSTEPKEIPGVWKIVSEDVFETPRQTDDDTVFNDAIKVVELEGEQEIRPCRTEHLFDRVEKGEQTMPVGLVDTSHSIIDRRRHAILQVLVSRNKTLEEDLEDADSLVARRSAILDKLKDLIEQIRPGTGVSYKDELADARIDAIVTRIIPPRKQLAADQLDTTRITYPSAWRLEIIEPGDESPRTINLGAIMGDPNHKIDKGIHGPNSDSILAQFDSAPEGRIKIKRYALTGNMFRAVEIGRNRRLGVPAYYIADNGARRRCVIVTRRDFDPKLLPVEVKDPRIAREALDRGHTLFTNVTNKKSEFHIRRYQGKYLMNLPLASDHKELFKNEEFLEYRKNNWGLKRTGIDITLDFNEVLNLIINADTNLFTSNQCRDWINEMTIEMKDAPQSPSEIQEVQEPGNTNRYGMTA